MTPGDLDGVGKNPWVLFPLGVGLFALSLLMTVGMTRDGWQASRPPVDLTLAEVREPFPTRVRITDARLDCSTMKPSVQQKASIPLGINPSGYAVVAYLEASRCAQLAGQPPVGVARPLRDAHRRELYGERASTGLLVDMVDPGIQLWMYLAPALALAGALWSLRDAVKYARLRRRTL